MLIREKPDPKLEQLINDLRVELLDKTQWAFGALFVGRRGGGFALFFAEGMPEELRMSLLNDIAKTVEAAKKGFAH